MPITKQNFWLVAHLLASEFLPLPCPLYSFCSFSVLWWVSITVSPCMEIAYASWNAVPGNSGKLALLNHIQALQRRTMLHCGMVMPAASNVSPIFKVIQRYGPSGLSPRCAADFLRELGQFLWSPNVSVIHVWNLWMLQRAVRIIILHSIRGSVW